MAGVKPADRIRAWLYDAAGHDRPVPFDAINPASLPDNQLLWIEAVDPGAPELERLNARLEGTERAISDLIRAVTDPERPLRLDKYDTCFTLVLAMPPKREAGARIGFAVGKTWLLSLHCGSDADFLDHFRGQDKAETAIGLLSPAVLLGSLLDWHLSAFLQAVSAIEEAVDALDDRILQGAPAQEVLRAIVGLRRRISLLRRTLADQRDVFYGLARADLCIETDAEALPHFERLSGRLERAIDEVERSRDVLIGSFDLFTSISAQSTNDLIRALTFATVVIGVCAAVAGLLGMNFKLALFDTGIAGFLAVVGALIAGTGASLWFARRRGWL